MKTSTPQIVRQFIADGEDFDKLGAQGMSALLALQHVRGGGGFPTTLAFLIAACDAALENVDITPKSDFLEAVELIYDEVARRSAQRKGKR